MTIRKNDMAVTMETVLDFRRPQFSSPKLSSASKSFFILNIIQVMLIGSIQTSMMVIGDYSAVSTQGMGPGRQVYMALFTGAVFYSCFLCLFAVKTENFLEIVAFVLQNCGYIAYSFIQVYHINYKTYHNMKFQTPSCLTILSVLNPVSLVVMNAIFIYLAFKLFVEYGWKIYKRVRFNIKLRAAYHLYELVICLMKMTVLFIVMFSVCVVCTVLRDRSSHPYYAVTFAKMPFAVTVCVVAVIGIHRENKLLMGIIIILLLIIEAGFIYDLYSITSRTCIGCKEIVESTIDIPQELLLHLVYLASVSLLFVFLLMLSTIKVTMNFGMGLKDHFAGLSKNSTVLIFGLSRDVVSTFFNSSLNKSGVFDHVPDVLENDSIVLNDTVITRGSPERNERNDMENNDILQYATTKPDTPPTSDKQRAERKSSTIPARLSDEQRSSVVERLSTQASERLNRIYLERRVSTDNISKRSCGCCFFQKTLNKDDLYLYPVSENELKNDGRERRSKEISKENNSILDELKDGKMASTRKFEFQNKRFVCASISEEPELILDGSITKDCNKNKKVSKCLKNSSNVFSNKETNEDLFPPPEFCNHGFCGETSSSVSHDLIGIEAKHQSYEEIHYSSNASSE